MQTQSASRTCNTAMRNASTQAQTKTTPPQPTRQPATQASDATQRTGETAAEYLRDHCTFTRQANRNVARACETRERATQTHKMTRTDAGMQREDHRKGTTTRKTAGQTKDAAMRTREMKDRQTREKEAWGREMCEREIRTCETAVQTEPPRAHPLPISARQPHTQPPPV
jgi:hypothetical protein